MLPIRNSTYTQYRMICITKHTCPLCVAASSKLIEGVTITRPSKTTGVTTGVQVAWPSRATQGQPVQTVEAPKRGLHTPMANGEVQAPAGCRTCSAKLKIGHKRHTARRKSLPTCSMLCSVVHTQPDCKGSWHNAAVNLLPGSFLTLHPPQKYGSRAMRAGVCCMRHAHKAKHHTSLAASQDTDQNLPYHTAHARHVNTSMEPPLPSSKSAQQAARSTVNNNQSGSSAVFGRLSAVSRSC
jgi:hypothetical protein